MAFQKKALSNTYLKNIFLNNNGKIYEKLGVLSLKPYQAETFESLWNKTKLQNFVSNEKCIN